MQVTFTCRQPGVRKQRPHRCVGLGQIKVVARGKNPTTVKVNDITSIDVINVSPETDAHETTDKMLRYQVKRLPFIENGKLVGILALGDLAIESIHDET